jgi:3-dehydroquinate synthetase
MKQAVNGNRAKNYFGLFHAPVATIVEPLLLVDLPREHLISGLVEALKHGLCQSEALLDAVVAVDPDRPSLPQLTEIVDRTVSAKLKILAADPLEMSVGQPLELGHKVGHSIEHLTDGSIPHGVCVAFGMLAEARFAARLGLVSAAAVDYIGGRVRLVTGGLSMPSFSPHAVAEQVRRDNHRRRAGVPFVFLEGPQLPFACTLELSDERLDALTAAIREVVDGEW